MTSTDEFVVQLALERSLINRQDVDAAKVRVATHSDPRTPPPAVVDVLVETGRLMRETVLQLLSEELAMPVVDLDEQQPASAAIAALPRELAVRYSACPVRIEGEALFVAIADPLNPDATDSIGHVLGMRIEPMLAAPEAIRVGIEKHYASKAGSAPEVLPKPAPEGTRERDAQVAESGGVRIPPGNTDDGADAPVIRLVQRIVHDAIRHRASDIHLEPMEKKFRLRFRVDGVLIEGENPPKRLQLPVVSHLKLMANMSIAEKRIPQDGRIRMTVAGKAVDLRVSCLPTVHGESIVIRLLDEENVSLGVSELGLFPDDREQLEDLISRPDGIFLVTGPTGSGKTTTLYACLHRINQPDRKIITVEDPIEYQLSGINQVPVRTDIGMTFAAALRSMLRQAPNIIMVGEIRDLETAEIAINASLTGHMVFSTLHTNDAPGAVTRLLDIGIKPFLVASAVRGTMAQRLVRRVCSRCAAPYLPGRTELQAINIKGNEALSATFMRGKGCPDCNGTGYRGRLGVFEFFPISEEIQMMIHDHVPASKLREKARSGGMRTMREDGIRKVLAGMTTIDEVASATVADPT